MYRLLYVSTISDTFKRSDVDDIITKAAPHNLSCGVTGLLMFNGLNFLQLLEGAREDVDRIYQSIIGDRRHISIVTLITENSDIRLFEGWGLRLKVVDSTVGHGEQASNSIEDILNEDIPEHIALIFRNFDTLKG